MMRDYGQVQSLFWVNPEVQSLSDHSKLLFLYLLTGPHTSALGCFRLPDNYVIEDLKYPIDTLSKGYLELEKWGFLRRCSCTKFVLLPDFLRWNPIFGPKVAAARFKDFQLVPKNFSHYRELVESMLKYCDFWGDHEDTLLHTLSHTQPDGYGIPNRIQEQEQEQEQEHSPTPTGKVRQVSK